MLYNKETITLIQKKYDVIIVEASPGGIFSAYELVKKIPI